ncbi:MAG: (d)CMP kinase [Gammaproteobacteria bacterium]|nr:(d)CMP kinase [Gammaproteobacteria bacterium]
MVPVIAIDGPGGSGKGTVARLIAQKFGWHLLDSGALYRLVALAGLRHGLAANDVDGHARLAAALDVTFEVDAQGEERVMLAESEVTRELRGEQTGEAASRVAAWPEVRSGLLGRQRAFARAPGLVADGRDMGSIVFCDAGLKVFLTASPQDRARRRYKQLKGKGLSVNLAALSAEIAERDRRDTTRFVAPLIAVPDAIVVDSTALSIEDVVGRVISLARERFPGLTRQI